MIIIKDLRHGCCDRCCIPIGRQGSAESPLIWAWLTWPARTNAMLDFRQFRNPGQNVSLQGGMSGHLILTPPVFLWEWLDFSHDISLSNGNCDVILKEHSTFLEIGLFYNSPRAKQLRFTVFESIQPISGSDGSTRSKMTNLKAWEWEYSS